MNPLRRVTLPFVVLLCFTVLLSVRTYTSDYHSLNLVFLNLIFLSLALNSRKITLYTGIGSGIFYALLWFTPYIHSDIVNEGIVYWGTLFLIAIITGFSMFILEGNKKIDQSLKHFFLLYENATEGIVISDERGRIVMANPTACTFFGYTEQEMLHHPVEILIPKKYSHSHPKVRMDYVKHPTNRMMGSGRELYGVRKDGTEIPIEISLSTYSDNHRKFVIAFIIDITIRKQNEQLILQKNESLEKMSLELAQLNEELETKVEERTNNLTMVMKNLENSQAELKEALEKEKELNEIKSRFVSMASHEFRTPLSTVLSSAALLQKYTNTEQQPNRDKHINKIKESVRHLNEILEDFLNLGKLDEDKISTTIQEVNIEELITQAVEETGVVKKPNQEIKFLFKGEEMALLDKNLLKNIYINLLTNAIKFSPDDGLIVIECINTKDNTSLIVKDNGIGIPDEDKEHLFSTFFRSKNAVNIQGTGLGLHIVKRYLDLMGGNINIESELNKGTTVIINLTRKPN